MLEEIAAVGREDERGNAVEIQPIDGRCLALGLERGVGKLRDHLVTRLVG